MMKKTYIIPAIEVIEFAAEQLIATSSLNPGIGSGSTPDGDVDAGGGLSNKRQPASNSWSSQNWGKDGE